MHSFGKKGFEWNFHVPFGYLYFVFYVVSVDLQPRKIALFLSTE